MYLWFYVPVYKLSFLGRGEKGSLYSIHIHKKILKNGIIRDKIEMLKVLELIYAQALCDLYVSFEN